MKKLYTYYAIIFIALTVVSIKAKSCENDELAFMFVSSGHINTEAQVIDVVYKCADLGRLTSDEYSKAMRVDLKGVTLDQRDYCESLKEELKGL